MYRFCDCFNKHLKNKVNFILVQTLHLLTTRLRILGQWKKNYQYTIEMEVY